VFKPQLTSEDVFCSHFECVPFLLSPVCVAVWIISIWISLALGLSAVGFDASYDDHILETHGVVHGSRSISGAWTHDFWGDDMSSVSSH